MTDDDLLTIIETDYRLRHMYWIEKRLNKRLEKWFRKTDEIDIDDLLAKKQINDLQIEVFAFYNKNDYEPVTRLSPEAYQSWISSIVPAGLCANLCRCGQKSKWQVDSRKITRLNNFSFTKMRLISVKLPILQNRNGRA